MLSKRSVNTLCEQLAHGALIECDDEIPIYPDLPSRILEGVQWRLDEPVCTDEESKAYLDTTFMDGYNVRFMYIELTIGLWQERERLGIVEIELPCTPRQVMDAIYTFYQRPVCTEFLEAIRAPDRKVDESEDMMMVEEDDSFCECAVDILASGHTAKYHHLMGDCVWFEGLSLKDPITYSIILSDYYDMS